MWRQQDNGTWRKVDTNGAVWVMPENQETVSVRLDDGREGYGRDEREAYERALRELPTEGVLPMTCRVCGEIFGAINAQAFADDLARNEAQYFCQACLQLPTPVVEELLTFPW